MPRVLLLAGVLLGLGCSGFIDRQAASSTYRILRASTQAAQRQVDVQLARDALPGGLVQVEAFAIAYPKHAGFKALHADMYCDYATGFVFDDWEDAALGKRDDAAAAIAARLRTLLATCADLNLARLPAAWRDAYLRNADLTPLLARATRAHAHALRWLGTADAVRIAIDPVRNFARLPRAEALLARASELEPGARDAAAETLLATLEASRGAVSGTTDGAARFARARALAGEGVLLVDVMYARGTAVARKDRVLFEATLRRVLAADVTRWPERRLANELARVKARRYLAALDTLIPPR